MKQFTENTADMLTVEEIIEIRNRERARIDHEMAERITNSRRPVFLYYSGPYTMEIVTTPDADGLHKWQAINGPGHIKEGRADILSIAAMLRTGNIL